MAGPILTKVGTKVAMAVAKDENGLKIILTIIGIILATIVFFSTFIIYILASPIEAISSIVTGDDLELIMNFRNDNGYIQQLYYDESEVGNYEDVIFSGNEVDVVYFNQLDERWKNKPYGTDNIGGYGCGPTSMAIVVSTLTDTYMDPVDMCNWSYDHGYWASKSGSYHSLIPNCAKSFGLTCTGNLYNDPQKIINELESGKLVVALMGKGHFTSSGHFIVLRGVTDDGKILVADPSSYERSNQEWDLEIIMDEAISSAGAGGPFWAIGN